MNTENHPFIEKKNPPLGVILTLICGIITAAVVGSIYGFAVAYNPVVQINVCLTFITGSLIGYCIAVCADKLKVRHTPTILAVAVLSAVSSLYFLHVTWIYATLEQEGLPAEWVNNPVEMLAFLHEKAKTGLWSIDDITPIGWQLYAIWVTEAAIIIWASVVVCSEYIKKLMGINTKADNDGEATEESHEEEHNHEDTQTTAEDEKKDK
jgi:hypothetical protein